MSVLLIHAFYVAILNLSLRCSIFDYDTYWNFFDCDIHWKYFCLWNSLAVLSIVILGCNTFIVLLPDSNLDMSVKTLWQSFCFDSPWKYHSTEILLIVLLPGSICLDSPFNLSISWQFC